MAVVGGEEVKEEVSNSQTKLEEEDEVEAQVEMQPWEQHSSVIIIPRYDYNAPSSLLQHSHPGFLITCPIRREKSATKEAISILEKFIGCNSFLEETDRDDATKRRKLCPVDEESKDTIRPDKPSKDADLSSKKNEELDGQKHTLSLVKLMGSGLLLFISPKDSSLDTVHVVSDVLQSIDSGALKHPLWCHRIMPIQATCKLSEKELSSVVSTLVRAFVSKEAIKLSKPLKFAVGYNRRGVSQTEMKSVKSSSSDLNPPAILDRDKCFAIVAASVKGAVPDAVVDLKSPEICILIECIPLSRVPGNSLVAAVSVLPHTLVCSKRKLSIKALTADSKSSNGGQPKE